MRIAVLGAVFLASTACAPRPASVRSACEFKQRVPEIEVFRTRVDFFDKGHECTGYMTGWRIGRKTGITTLHRKTDAIKTVAVEGQEQKILGSVYVGPSNETAPVDWTQFTLPPGTPPTIDRTVPEPGTPVWILGFPCSEADDDAPERLASREMKVISAPVIEKIEGLGEGWHSPDVVLLSRCEESINGFSGGPAVRFDPETQRYVVFGILVYELVGESEYTYVAGIRLNRPCPIKATVVRIVPETLLE